MYSEQQTPESLLNVWPRVVRAICYPESTGTISTKLGEGQSLPPDGAREQVCKGLRILMRLTLTINNHVVIGDAKQAIPGSLTHASCCLCDGKAPSSAWECNYV